MQSRLEWLTAVLTGSEDDLKTLNNKLKEESESMSSKAESRDNASKCRAGPCAGYDQLEPFSVCERHGLKFRACTSEAQIKDTAAEMVGLKKLFTVLQASCSSSVTRLRGAQTQAKLQKKKAEKAAEEAAKKKRAADSPAKGGRPTKKAAVVAEHPYFKMSIEQQVPTEPSLTPQLSLSSPFILSGISLPEASSRSVLQAVEDFKELFAQSAIRATEGRAQASFTEETGETVRQFLGEHVSAEQLKYYTSLSMLVSTEGHEALAKHLRPAAFGIAACHQCAPKFDVGLMGSFRYHLEGTRLVLMVSAIAVQEFLGGPKSFADCQQWIRAADEAKLTEFLNKFPRATYTCTVGPQDLLFIPAMWMTGHRVLNATDCCGIRFPYFSPSERSIYQQGEASSGMMKTCLTTLDIIAADEKRDAPSMEADGNANGAPKVDVAVAAAVGANIAAIILDDDAAAAAAKESQSQEVKDAAIAEAAAAAKPSQEAEALPAEATAEEVEAAKAAKSSQDANATAKSLKSSQEATAEDVEAAKAADSSQEATTDAAAAAIAAVVSASAAAVEEAAT